MTVSKLYVIPIYSIFFSPTTIPNHLFHILKIRWTFQTRKSQHGKFKSVEVNFNCLPHLHSSKCIPSFLSLPLSYPLLSYSPGSWEAFSGGEVSAIVTQVWLEFVRSPSLLWGRSFLGVHGAGQVLSGVRAEGSAALAGSSTSLWKVRKRCSTIRGWSGGNEQQTLFEQINVQPTCQDFGFTKKGSKFTL